MALSQLGKEALSWFLRMFRPGKRWTAAPIYRCSTLPSATYLFSGDFGRIWGGKSLFSDFSKKKLVLKKLGFSNGS